MTLDSSRMEVRRGPSDVLRVVFIHGMLGPLILLGAGSFLGARLFLAAAFRESEPRRSF